MLISSDFSTDFCFLFLSVLGVVCFHFSKISAKIFILLSKFRYHVSFKIVYFLNLLSKILVKSFNLLSHQGNPILIFSHFSVMLLSKLFILFCYSPHFSTHPLRSTLLILSKYFHCCFILFSNISVLAIDLPQLINLLPQS